MACNGTTIPDIHKTSTDRSKQKQTLRTKVFIEQNSIVDELINNQNAVVVYRFATIIVVGLVIHTAMYDYFYKGKINFGQRLILSEFATFFQFWIIWGAIYISNFGVYFCFKYWAIFRTNMQINLPARKIWDYSWFALAIIYYPSLLYLATFISFKQELTNTLSLAYFCEVTRMLMKIYAFIRSNVPRVISYKSHSGNEVLFPSMSQFAYFLWAPTLVYRDSYPRTKSIRWTYVGYKAVEFTVVLLCLSVTLERYFIFSYKDYGIKYYSWTDIATLIFGNFGGGILLTLSPVYLILYTWQSAFAEICRFADRRFFEDWWNSSDYQRYYRTWNVIVHDWLYTYIYKDFYEVVIPGNKFIAKYVVFTISAIFHEYILGFGFGFFIPILFLQFISVGTILTFIKMKPHAFGNVFLLYTLALGNSINGSFYAMEYYSRFNCPIENPTMYDYLVPRLFSCTSS